METDTAVGAGVRVTLSRDDLSSRLALVSRATSTRGTVQVLGGVLLRASDGLVELEATDMELSLRTTVPAEVEGEGALVMPARLLGDIVKLLPAESVTLAYRAEDGVASIESGSYSSRVNVFAAEDFPRLPSIDVPLQEVERRVAARDRAARLARRVARRVEAGPHGDPRAVRGLAADDGRDRLVPHGRQGDRARDRAARSSRRSSPPARSTSSAGSPPAPRPFSSASTRTT